LRQFSLPNWVTKLATMLFASGKDVSKLTVFVGASLALIVASGVGVLAGSFISQYINEKQLQYVAGAGFFDVKMSLIGRGRVAQLVAFRCV